MELAGHTGPPTHPPHKGGGGAHTHAPDRHLLLLKLGRVRPGPALPETATAQGREGRREGRRGGAVCDGGEPKHRRWGPRPAAPGASLHGGCKAVVRPPWQRAWVEREGALRRRAGLGRARRKKKCRMCNTRIHSHIILSTRPLALLPAPFFTTVHAPPRHGSPGPHAGLPVVYPVCASGDGRRRPGAGGAAERVSFFFFFFFLPLAVEGTHTPAPPRDPYFHF